MYWPGLEPTSYIVQVHLMLKFLNFTIGNNRCGKRIVGANPQHRRSWNNLLLHYFSLKNFESAIGRDTTLFTANFG